MKRLLVILRFAAAVWLLAVALPPSAQACAVQGCVMAGPRLVNVSTSQGNLIGPLLGSLTGTSVNASVIDWTTLSNNDIKVADFVNALQAQLGVSSPTQALTTSASVAQILTATASAATIAGNAPLATAINGIKVPLGVAVGSVTVGDLVKISGVAGNTSINVLDLITGVAQTYNKSNVATTTSPVALNVGGITGLTGVTSVQLYAQVIEPAVYQCGGTGTAFHTAGIRLKLDIVIPAVNAQSVGAVAGVNITSSTLQILNHFTLYVEIARAEGTISMLNLVSNAMSADAIPGVVDLYLGSIDDAVFFNRSHTLQYADFDYANIADLNLSINTVVLGTIPITGSVGMRSTARGQAPSSNTTLSFSAPYPQTKTVSSSTVSASALLTSLIASLDLKVTLVPQSPIGALLSTLVSGILNNVKPLITTVISPVLSTVLASVVDPLLASLGISIGQAVVTAYGVFNVCSISGYCYADVNHDSLKNIGEAGTGQTLYAKLVSTSSPTTVYQSTAVTPATGAFSFQYVVADNYILLIDTNATTSDVTASRPTGWISSEQSTFSKSLSVSTSDPANQNFGLYNGSKASGMVFLDTGIGSGGLANNVIRDGTETSFVGVTVSLTDNAGTTTYDTTTSGDNGTYALWIPATAGAATLKIVESTSASYVSAGANVGTTGGAYTRATDTIAFTNTVGTLYSSVNFADVPAEQFDTDGRQTVLAGNVAFYPHSFTAGTAGQITFSGSALATTGWSHQIFRDTNCNGAIDTGETQISGAVAATAGQKVCLLVKVFASETAAINDQYAVTVNASFAYANSALIDALARNDLTVVGSASDAGLRLLKSVDKTSAKTGDVLTYTIAYTNNSASALTNLKVFDSTPGYTVFTSAACGTLGTGLTACSVAAQPNVGTAGAVQWSMTGTLAPAASGTVTLRVTLQ